MLYPTVFFGLASFFAVARTQFALARLAFLSLDDGSVRLIECLKILPGVRSSGFDIDLSTSPGILVAARQSSLRAKMAAPAGSGRKLDFTWRTLGQGCATLSASLCRDIWKEGSGVNERI